MIFSWQVISFSLFLLFSLTVRAQIPSGVQIANIQAIGTGCPQGSFSANISPDGKLPRGILLEGKPAIKHAAK